MLGAVMYASDLMMEAFPNIHLLGVFIIAETVVYRQKALYPIYIYVLLNGLMAGFSAWWVPYLYVWTVLWGATMLLPQNLPAKVRPVVYTLLCGLHGFLFGILYAPAQAILFSLSFEATIAWVMAGIPFDLVHGVSNLIAGLLICPLISLLKRAERISRT